MDDAKAYAIGEYEKYRIIQDKLYQSDFDKLVETTKGDPSLIMLTKFEKYIAAVNGLEERMER